MARTSQSAEQSNSNGDLIVKHCFAECCCLKSKAKVVLASSQVARSSKSELRKLGQKRKPWLNRIFVLLSEAPAQGISA